MSSLIIKSFCRSTIYKNGLNEDLLKDAFDKDFLNKLKEETKSLKHETGTPIDNKGKKIFSNTMFTHSKFSNIKTNPTTPDIRTPVRSPNTNKNEERKSRATFHQKVKKENEIFQILEDKFERFNSEIFNSFREDIESCKKTKKEMTLEESTTPLFQLIKQKCGDFEL